uniref:Ig-like domain-containing protein n=1 Tax=Sphenodon punctatus TaxID=8508 RepID=A0A8D0H771_SPHPU
SLFPPLPGTLLPAYVLEGEPLAARCSVDGCSDCNITWYKNDSDKPVTTEEYSRIHQRNNLLWFIPANLEDSGFYRCVIQNPESSYNEVEVKVFKN